MNEEFNSENSDVTEVAIETEETVSPLDQLNEFKKSGPDGCQSAALALPTLAVCLIGTLMLMEAVLGHGYDIPLVVFVLMLIVPAVVGLATVAQLRQWFLGKLNSPTGCRVTHRIRFLGGMLMVLCILLGFVLVCEPRGYVRAGQWLLLATWLTVGLMMRFFPRGEPK